MSKIAFLFPGQGSQRVGMGKQLLDVYPHVAAPYFQAADDILGFSLSSLCFHGPEEELVKTENQQPAIFLVSTVTWAVLAERGVHPQAVAGHSLGEYSALAAAGAFDFETALRVTRRRGELMAEVGEAGGIMAAVLGPASDEVAAACREASDLGVVDIANYNSPTQTVISGESMAVTDAVERLKQLGAQRIIQLPVSAPFHSSLMAPLAARFEPLLREADVRDAAIPVIANATATWETSAAEIRRNLVSQLASPVRWVESVRLLLNSEYHTFIEVGPQKVLTGLMRAIDRNVEAFSSGDASALDRVVELLQTG